MATPAGMVDRYSRPALRQLYKHLLRSCQTFPSTKRQGMYQAIREEWREHRTLQETDPKREAQIAIAYKGLQQLRQYDTQVMGGGNSNSSDWSVTLEQNPMPKPKDYEDRKNDR